MNVQYETKHSGNKAGTHEWLTPPEIIKVLGKFDLDPCYNEPRIFETADNYYNEEQNGLIQPWYGMVWCNPPYGDNTEKWLSKCSEHKDCIALIFARTDTKMFRDYIWNKAKAILFIYGRLSFYRPDGSKGDGAGAPSCLVTWSEKGVERLKKYKNGKMLLIDTSDTIEDNGIMDLLIN